MTAPDPHALHPTTRPDLTNVVFLATETTPNSIEIGDFTYYDNEGWRDQFETTNVKYLYGPQRLMIGRFCAIGPGTTFLMPAGNHPMVGPSTFPLSRAGANSRARLSVIKVKSSIVSQARRIPVRSDGVRSVRSGWRSSRTLST